MVPITKWIKGRYKKFRSKLSKTFLIEENGKKRVNVKSTGICFVGIAILFIIGLMVRAATEDTSMMAQTDKPIESKSNPKSKSSSGVSDDVAGVMGSSTNIEAEAKKKQSSNSKHVNVERKYKAAQVIVREGSYQREKTIPIGTNLIGKLLVSIDTRETEQFYKVFLPYGGNFKEGAEIPKGSTLFGKIKYSGKGRKVFMTFSKGVFPTGEEFEIEAQALNSKDYSPGLVGDFHGRSGARVAAALGLSIVSGASTLLMDREQLGAQGVTAPKATLKNAMYGGLSQAANTEAERQGQRLSEKTEYVTIDAGKDLIINLTGAYKKK